MKSSHHRTGLVIGLLAFASFGSVAHAATPALSLARADRSAAKEVRETVAFWQGEWDDYVADCAADWDPEGCDTSDPADSNWYITDSDLSPCERTSRTRAACEVAYSLSTGEECDAALSVRTNRRGRVSVRSFGWDCTSEPL